MTTPLGKSAQLIAYIRSLPDFSFADCIDANRDHTGATITDGILQAGTRYSTVVKPRVQRLLLHYPEARTTTGFLSALEAHGTGEVLQWKDPEKLRRILELAEFLKAQGVETESDFRDWLQKPTTVAKLKHQRGVKQKTAEYFKILVGLQTAAVDRHLRNFVGLAGITVALARVKRSMRRSM